MITNTRICPVCGYDTEVFDSRHKEETGVIVRKRKCLSCGHIFRTAEISIETYEELKHKTDIANKVIGFAKNL